jgi:hypothetical protein
VGGVEGFSASEGNGGVDGIMTQAKKRRNEEEMGKEQGKEPRTQLRTKLRCKQRAQQAKTEHRAEQKTSQIGLDPKKAKINKIRIYNIKKR